MNITPITPNFVAEVSDINVASITDESHAPAAHPAIIGHSETVQQILYLGPREWAYITDLELEESERLLDEVWAYATVPKMFGGRSGCPMI